MLCRLHPGAKQRLNLLTLLQLADFLELVQHQAGLQLLGRTVVVECADDFFQMFFHRTLSQ